MMDCILYLPASRLMATPAACGLMLPLVLSKLREQCLHRPLQAIVTENSILFMFIFVIYLTPSFDII